MRFPRARVISIVAVLAAGMALAVIGPLTGKSQNSVCHVASLVFSSGWAWACFAFLVGLSRRSKIESALLASSALAIAVAVYYIFKFEFPTSPVGHVVSSGSAGELGSKILVWGIAAFILGAPVGLLGHFARRPDIAGVLFRLLIPLIAFIETSARLETEAPSQGPVAEITWKAIRLAAGVAFVSLLVHGVAARHARGDDTETEVSRFYDRERPTGGRAQDR